MWKAALCSRYPDRFAWVAALAPDSFFEASLLSEIYSALPAFEKLGGVRGVRAELESGRLLKRKDAHLVTNVIAMGLCYAPLEGGEIDLPVLKETGVLIAEKWAKWKAHDPIVFLRERENSLSRVERVFLDVGKRDEYHLQLGARQIRDLLLELGVVCDYSEFDGTHGDIGERRILVWRWLVDLWR